MTLKRKIIHGLAYFCRLRRSAINSLTVRLDEAGTSPFSIQDVMQHVSVDTSGVYLRERLKRIRGAQQLLIGEVFPGNANSPEEPGNQTWQKAGNEIATIVKATMVRFCAVELFAFRSQQKNVL